VAAHQFLRYSESERKFRKAMADPKPTDGCGLTLLAMIYAGLVPLLAVLVQSAFVDTMRNWLFSYIFNPIIFLGILVSFIISFRVLRPVIDNPILRRLRFAVLIIIFSAIAILLFPGNLAE
jgi:hypothetical protein